MPNTLWIWQKPDLCFYGAAGAQFLLVGLVYFSSGACLFTEFDAVLSKYKFN